MDTLPVSFDDVVAAAERINPYVHRTPVLTSATLNSRVEAEVFFKCENLQKVGAFKTRGATNAVRSLSAVEASHGVATHSSGNHGAALAYAAATRGIPAYVVMPEDAPGVKVDAVRTYGAEIVFCAQEDRESTAAGVVASTGATLIHPFDDPRVIAGQGTTALELLSDVPGLDMVVAPIGGGGLLSGTALSVRALAPEARIVGAEPEEVDDAFRSLASGERQPRVSDPQTIADGLLTGIGVLPFQILTATGAEVVTVTESEIVAAAVFHLQRMKLVVEPSGATGLAVVEQLARRGLTAGLRVGIIISGGNTDLAWMPR